MLFSLGHNSFSFSQKAVQRNRGARESSRIHACGLGWDRGYLVAVVSLFNEITYGLRLCLAARGEYTEARHFFDPLARIISEAPISD